MTGRRLTRLAPAWEALVGLHDRPGRHIGGGYRDVARPGRLRLELGPIATGRFAEYRRPDASIVVGEQLAEEDPRALAAVLAHELWHALQAQVGLDRARDCFANEVEAFQAQAHVWSLFWPPGELPARTRLQVVLTEIATVTAGDGEAGLDAYIDREPGYRRVCAVGRTAP
jgi:hypothetical protein